MTETWIDRVPAMYGTVELVTEWRRDGAAWVRERSYYR